MFREKKDLKNLTPLELRDELRSIGEPDFRAAQILSWLYKKRKTSPAEFTDLPKELRQKLEERFIVSRMEIAGQFRSRDGTRKFVFKLPDGFLIETVLIPSDQRMTICLSTQAGCKFACAFCASGLKGFKRDLTPSEITGQILSLPETGSDELTNFVFMGMGEPLDNRDLVEKTIGLMNAPETMGIAARRMTISTCGLVPGIKRLAKLDLQINLSLSLHASTDKLRDELMPVNRKYPLEQVIGVCEEHLNSGGRMMTLEYALIRNVNDSLTDAEGLAGIARRLRAKVNLIAYSPVPGLAFQRPDETAIRIFIRWLRERRIPVTRRRSRGQDIGAACGQLAGRIF